MDVIVFVELDNMGDGKGAIFSVRDRKEVEQNTDRILKVVERILGEIVDKDEFLTEIKDRIRTGWNRILTTVDTASEEGIRVEVILIE